VSPSAVLMVSPQFFLRARGGVETEKNCLLERRRDLFSLHARGREDNLAIFHFGVTLLFGVTRCDSHPRTPLVTPLDLDLPTPQAFP